MTILSNIQKCIERLERTTHTQLPTTLTQQVDTLASDYAYLEINPFAIFSPSESISGDRQGQGSFPRHSC
jgi:hypothetical protein